MDKIDYVEIPARHEVRVYIGKRRIGTIVRIASKTGGWTGYEYRPKGSSHMRGDSFKTLSECKSSLEAA